MNSTLTMKILTMNKPECSSKQTCVKNVGGFCHYTQWCIYKVIKDKTNKAFNEKKSS